MRWSTDHGPQLTDDGKYVTGFFLRYGSSLQTWTHIDPGKLGHNQLMTGIQNNKQSEDCKMESTSLKTLR